jgi:hypothetical protein
MKQVNLDVGGILFGEADGAAAPTVYYSRGLYFTGMQALAVGNLVLGNEFTTRFWTKPESGVVLSSNDPRATSPREEDIFVLEIRDNRIGVKFCRGKERFADGLSSEHSLIPGTWTLIQAAL